jgi:outer membrane lipoprotein-sorting protein
MKKISFLIILLIIIIPVLNAQSDPSAQKLLDSFSSKALAAPSVSIKFKLVTIDQTENSNNTIDGSIVLNNDKYKLVLPDNTTWFNGSYSWTYMAEVNEVTITKPQTGDDTFLSKPSSLFTLYKKGYKNRLISENTSEAVIDLYPEDIKSDLIRIRLTISKPGMELKNAEYKTRNGVIITLNIVDYNSATRYDPSFFTFDPKTYKGIEIVDLR